MEATGVGLETGGFWHREYSRVIDSLTRMGVGVGTSKGT